MKLINIWKTTAITVILTLLLSGCGASNTLSANEENASETTEAAAPETLEMAEAEEASTVGAAEIDTAETSQEADTSQKTAESSSGSAQYVSPLKVNDQITITDPEGLDYDERLIIWTTDDEKYFSDQGIYINEQYIVFYGKENTVVGIAQYNLFADEESAAKYVAGYFGSMSIDGCVGTFINADPEQVRETLDQNKKQGLEGDSVADFSGFYLNSNMAWQIYDK